MTNRKNYQILRCRGKSCQSNIELLRIITMLLIVLLHCNYFALGGQSTFDIHSAKGFTRVLCEQLTIVGVDVFVLISGWFGIHAKLKGAFSLLFQVVFFFSCNCYFMQVLQVFSAL